MANTKSTGTEAGSDVGSVTYPSAAAAAQALFDPMKEQRLAESLKNQLRMKMRESELVPVTLAPTYRHPFGKVMCVRLNGMAIYIPCDGKTYKIPKPFAAIVHARRRAFDEQELRQEQMAAVTNNNEQFPGQLQFG